jgi:hypothetical protein
MFQNSFKSTPYASPGLAWFDCSRSNTNYQHRHVSYKSFEIHSRTLTLTPSTSNQQPAVMWWLYPILVEATSTPWWISASYLLSSKKRDILLTFFFVTGEWLGLIDSNTKNSTIQFASIPNVIPSELVRGADSTRLWWRRWKVRWNSYLIKLTC